MMTTIIISICFVIFSICSFIVALLNRLDNLRPQIYVILNTKKDQEGKRIKAENIKKKTLVKYLVLLLVLKLFVKKIFILIINSINLNRCLKLQIIII